MNTHAYARRMRLSRQMLNTAARRRQLGSLAPFVHPQLVQQENVPMPRTALDTAPKTGIVPKVVTSAKVAATVETYDAVTAKISQLKAKQEILKAELLALHEKYGKKFEAGDFTVTEVPGTNTYIARDRLVKAGVKASVIDACTVKTPYTYPKVTRKKTDPTFEVGQAG